LALEQAKYENIFNFQIVVGENVPENILMPPLLLQPFIENSIRHGILNLKKECGKILINFSVEKILYYAFGRQWYWKRTCHEIKK
jgi:LytS/YehU family sensor histidine kinase